jgi:hypothetical protein
LSLNVGSKNTKVLRLVVFKNLFNTVSFSGVFCYQRIRKIIWFFKVCEIYTPLYEKETYVETKEIVSKKKRGGF